MIMDYYINVKILPDAEIGESFLLNTVYSKLHKALYDLQSSSIGISFPQYHVRLGRVLRIHGIQQELDKLQTLNWLARLSDYCEVSPISAVPENIKGYRTLSRIQPSMSQSKLRRLVKRGSITEEEAKSYKAKMFSKGLDNPYLELESSSNSHKHRRYIQFGELLDTPIEGAFDTFGLSKTATIPWF